MTRARGVTVALIAALAAAAPSPAQTQDKVKSPATLADLVEYAARNSPALRSLDARLDAGKSRVIGAYSSWWPSVEAAFSHAQVSPLSDTENIDETWWTLSARQRIADFGRTGSIVESLKSDERAIAARKKRALHALKVEVAKRYYDYLLALEAVDVYLQTNAIAYVHWDRDREKHEVGLLSRRTVSRGEELYRIEKLNLTRAEAEAALSLNLLQEIIGAPVGEYFEPARAPEGPPAISLPELAGIEEKALEKRPELAVHDERINALRASLLAARADYFPVIDGVAEAGDSTREFFSKNHWKAGVEARMTIFDGFSRASKMDEIEAKIRSAEFDREEAARRIRMEVRGAYNEIALNEPKALLAEAKLKSAQDNLDYARSEYELNLVAELGDAFAQYAKAKLFMMRTYFALRLDLMRLALATGDDPYPVDITSETGDDRGAK